MNKSILCLFVITCVFVAVSYASPADNAAAALADSFSSVDHHDGSDVAHVDGDADQQLQRQKRQFFGGYGGYGGGYGGYGGGFGRRRFFGGYGGYGGGFRRYGGYGGYGR